MNIITANPVVSQQDWDNDNEYSELFGSSANRRARRRSRKRKRSSKRRTKGSFGDRLKRGFQSVKSSGVLDVLGGGGRPQQDMGRPPVNEPALEMPYVPPTETIDTKKGLSKTAKIAIGVGVAAVIGVGIYFLVKKKR